MEIALWGLKNMLKAKSCSHHQMEWAEVRPRESGAGSVAQRSKDASEIYCNATNYDMSIGKSGDKSGGVT
jgi:hypothetical protein